LNRNNSGIANSGIQELKVLCLFNLSIPQSLNSSISQSLNPSTPSTLEPYGRKSP
jgi:hypothetical protein